MGRRFEEVVSMQLEGVTWGKNEPGVPRLLLLHGMGGVGALWRPIAAALEADFCLFAPDQRGHGKSAHIDPATGFTPLDYGTDVIETLKERHFFPTWVVGHSMGVRTAVAAAYLKPEWVQGLVLVDLGFSGMAGGGLGEKLAHFLKRLPIAFESRGALREFLEKEAPEPGIARYLQAVALLEGEGLRFPFDPSSLIQTILAARDTSVRAWLEALVSRAESPLSVLALRGLDSQVWLPENYEKEKQHFAVYPSVQFEEVPGAGHGLPFEQRSWFVARLRAWIQMHTA